MENQKNQQRVSEIQISYRSPLKPSERPKITQSREAYNILLNSWDQDRIELVEQFKILLLNRANRVLGICEISSGGGAGTVVDPKLVFMVALKANAHGIIAAHNHPSGNLQPSQADMQLTDKLKAAGKFLELQLLDHIIVTKEAYCSMADDGFL